ncbi:hypothetical protein T439DRAFT_223322 [Meredithblackwellia eburnea MCA 4105]
MIDHGSQGNLIDATFALAHRIPLVPHRFPIPLEGFDGKSAVLLGAPWIRTHDVIASLKRNKHHPDSTLDQHFNSRHSVAAAKGTFEGGPLPPARIALVSAASFRRTACLPGTRVFTLRERISKMRSLDSRLSTTTLSTSSIKPKPTLFLTLAHTTTKYHYRKGKKSLNPASSTSLKWSSKP